MKKKEFRLFHFRLPSSESNHIIWPYLYLFILFLFSCLFKQYYSGSKANLLKLKEFFLTKMKIFIRFGLQLKIANYHQKMSLNAMIKKFFKKLKIDSELNQQIILMMILVNQFSQKISIQFNSIENFLFHSK